jgi:hypothetical protein
VQVHSEQEEEAAGGGVEQVETDIVEQFMTLLEESPAERREELKDKVVNKVQELGPDVELISIRKQSSIGSYFVCKTLAALQRLYQMYLSGQFQTFLEELFTLLLKNSQRIRIKNLVWSQTDYDNCVQYLSTLEGIHCNDFVVSFCAFSPLPLPDIGL